MGFTAPASWLGHRRPGSSLGAGCAAPRRGGTSGSSVRPSRWTTRPWTSPMTRSGAKRVSAWRPSGTSSRGRMTSSWASRHGRWWATSSARGSRLPGGRALTTLVMKTSARAQPGRREQVVEQRARRGPTNGRPCASSLAPGASPTMTTGARRAALAGHEVRGLLADLEAARDVPADLGRDRVEQRSAPRSCSLRTSSPVWARHRDDGRPGLDTARHDPARPSRPRPRRRPRAGRRARSSRSRCRRLLRELDTTVEGVAPCSASTRSSWRWPCCPTGGARLVGARASAPAGFALFAAASLGCGAPATLPALLAARAVQAVGGAAALVAAFALLRAARRATGASCGSPRRCSASPVGPAPWAAR